MSIKTGLSLSMLVLSCVSYAAPKDQICVESTVAIEADAAQIMNSMQPSTQLSEEYFSEQLPFTVEVSRKLCKSTTEITQADNPPLPDYPAEGDSRTITQERDGWVSEWQQIFRSGSWVTMRYTRWRKVPV